MKITAAEMERRGRLIKAQSALTDLIVALHGPEFQDEDWIDALATAAVGRFPLRMKLEYALDGLKRTLAKGGVTLSDLEWASVLLEQAHRFVRDNMSAEFPKTEES